MIDHSININGINKIYTEEEKIITTQYLLDLIDNYGFNYGLCYQENLNENILFQSQELKQLVLNYIEAINQLKRYLEI